jgi:sugar O-acyltransferase (sialic acid O-acetyltransferase NeuD family)
MTEKIVLVGGGGHCKSCIDVIETTDHAIAGIVDAAIKGKLLHYDIIGNDDVLEELISKNHLFLITVGQISSASLRVRLFEKIKKAGGRFVTIVPSTAIVSKYSEIGEGTIIMHQAIVNANARIGSNCIINNKSLVEHDCIINDHVHISTAAIVNGGCTIGKGVFVGSNAVIVQGVEVADDVIIGAGAVVARNITNAGTYAGNPARKITGE